MAARFSLRRWRRLAIGLVVAGAALLASGQASHADAPPASPECGGPALPACPMQQWMRDHMAVPYAKGDLERLATSFEQVEQLNPRANKWHNWKTFCVRGARTARDGAKHRAVGECTHCHKIYRREYNMRYRKRAIPPGK